MKKCSCALLALCLLTGCGTGQIVPTDYTPPQTGTTEYSAMTAPQTGTTGADMTEADTTEREPETTSEIRTQTAPPTDTSLSAATTATVPEYTVAFTTTASTAPRTTTAPTDTSASASDTTTAQSATVQSTTHTTAQTSGTTAQSDTPPTVQQIGTMPAGTVLQHALSDAAVDALFSAEPLSDAVLQRITGVSYRENPDIQPGDLRYLRMLHRNAEGQIQIGEMIVNASISDDVLEIFRALFDADYPIARMVLVDEYGADDNVSMAANNTSAFNYRKIANTDTLSRHARGMAIDVNPLYNPYITRRSDGSEQIAPAGAEPYADRTADFPMKITADDLCCRLFAAHGFTWGGSWSNPKDYQHFEK